MNKNDRTVIRNIYWSITGLIISLLATRDESYFRLWEDGNKKFNDELNKWVEEDQE